MSDNTYKVDITHSGLRLVSLATMLIGALLGSFVIVPALARVLGIGEALGVSLLCIGGPAIGLGVGWAVERYLQVVWPSGRWLKVSEEGATLRERSGEAIKIRWAEPVDVFSWYFVLRGGRMWAPRGWYCVACQLAQEGRAITAYTFMKPIDAQAMTHWDAFPELISRKPGVRQAAGGAQQSDGQEQLWAAERNRWDDGAEMTPTDFAALIGEIDQQVAGWPG